MIMLELDCARGITETVPFRYMYENVSFHNRSAISYIHRHVRIGPYISEISVLKSQIVRQQPPKWIPRTQANWPAAYAFDLNFVENRLSVVPYTFVRSECIRTIPRVRIWTLPNVKGSYREHETFPL